MSKEHLKANAEAMVEEQEHHGLSHVVPVKLLFAIFLALLFLTWLTWMQSYIPLGNFTLYVALAIASIKASLVVLFFMHMFWDRGFNLVIFLSCLFFVSLFIGAALTDAQTYQPSVQWVESPLVEQAQQQDAAAAKDKLTAQQETAPLKPAAPAPAGGK